MERYICIHGHFYQPPRENPWLEAIELQDSAAPYHDWNERITAECYAPNSASRILDEQDRIVKLVNNYARISFNFGPTLLSWLESHAPRVYAAILAADRESQKHYSGHGSAIAQIYNHVIMPLANSRDRATQILWGIGDFKKRFERAPEGMWLSETAVDIRDPRATCAKWYPLYDPCASSSGATASHRHASMARTERRAHRLDPSLSATAAIRSNHCAVFLRRRRGPRRGLRGGAFARRTFH